VLAAALVLAACLLLVVLVLPPALAAAEWPQRAPVLALVLWQAAGLAAGLLTLVLAATVALAPLGDTHLHALRHLDRAGPLTWVVGGLGLLVLLRLLGVLVASTARTLRDRHRNRVLVDLVAERNLMLRGASVIDHDLPVAYCLPGLRPRLVLSRGALSVLSYDELRAVLAHERAHLTQRHDLVVLPFVALGATFPAVPAVRTARAEVALLVELLADDRAARRHDREHLAKALWKIGTGAAPAGALGAAGDDVLLRARRLLEPPCPLGRTASVAVAGLAVAVAASPLLGLVVPVLV
jgi:Zn-dependent protease with chaperone function